ncbi:lactate dehydrogenase [Synechococcus sp. GFB01]|uniref:lactate dehydrogenase n=1 Tax=Synechococcus sp. GFB01 TaxID=1662190 RepID=UPI001F3AAFFB|nr:lactate dehydrogenase [Synechococcus sp. GFB01]
MYIASDQMLRASSQARPPDRAGRLGARIHSPPPIAALVALLPLALAVPASRADVVFENCQRLADGGLTCDTRPTGNTLLDAEAARYGLLQQASPGWNEFEPFAGDDEMFGGNET